MEGGEGVTPQTTHLPDIILRFMLLLALPGAPGTPAAARAPGTVEEGVGVTAGAVGMVKGGVTQPRPSCPLRLESSALKEITTGGYGALRLLQHLSI